MASSSTVHWISNPGFFHPSKNGITAKLLFGGKKTLSSGFWSVPAAYFPVQGALDGYLSSLASPSKVPLPDRLCGTLLHSQALPISHLWYRKEDDYENPISIDASPIIPSAGLVSWMLPLTTMRPK